MESRKTADERKFPERHISRPRVLVVEDENDVRELIRYNLMQEGIEVEEARDGKEALARVRARKPDLLVLDLMLPEIPGLEVCRMLRSQQETRGIGIIIVTAKASETDKVLALELGADDYVTKPFSPRELNARIKALLRRSAAAEIEQSNPRTYEHGRLRVDFIAHEVFVEGKRRELTLREFELLGFLVHHPTRVFSREQLLDLLWGDVGAIEPRTIDVHVHRLRKELERDELNPTLIVTVRGVGYRFDPDG